MVNLRRGEIEAVLDGRPRRLVLTLGALAELEAAFGADDLVALSERLAAGRLAARDLARIIAAGLSGAGDKADETAVAAMTTEGGAAGFAAIAARLIAASFGGDPAPQDVPSGDRPDPQRTDHPSDGGQEGIARADEAPDPMPGTAVRRTPVELAPELSGAPRAPSATPAPRLFPWDAVLRTAIAGWGLAPEAVWSMSLREFLAAAGASLADAPPSDPQVPPTGSTACPSRADLARLMALCPDRE